MSKKNLAICFVMLWITQSASAVVTEWSDIPYVEGQYSNIYFDWVVTGSRGTFYCMNDWMTNQNDDGVSGGLLSNEYNRFNFSLGGNSYEIRIFPTGEGSIYINGSLNNNALENFTSACSWGTSPSNNVDHTMWEFAFQIEGTTSTISTFVGCDPPGPTVVVVENPPAPPLILTGGPSSFGHYVDGEFSDIPVTPTLAPTPTREYQEPIIDPWFPSTGWTIDLLNEGGVRITPEPATMALLGLGGLAMMRKRKA